MDPHLQFCPNQACSLMGQIGQDNIRIHSHVEHRYRCLRCGKTFSERQGSAFYRLRHSPEEVSQVLTLLGFGCPIVAIVMAFGLDERTVVNWQKRGAKTAQQVQQQKVEQTRPLNEVQCDELRIRIQGGVVWMAMAIESQSRLWLGGVVSRERDQELLKQLMGIVKACTSALSLGLVIVTDGLNLYPNVIRKTFREALRTGKRGRPAWVNWPRVWVVQIVKQYQKRTLIGVRRDLVEGSAEQIERVRYKAHEQGVLNTAFIERLNGTFRARIAPLTRRTHHLARYEHRLSDVMLWVGVLYNFCTYHRSLRLPGIIGGHRWLERTPAMAAGLSDHCWSVQELLSLRFPPPPLPPPKRPPGRPPNQQSKPTSTSHG
jgi:transposase-like protein/IS1 family transposase